MAQPSREGWGHGRQYPPDCIKKLKSPEEEEMDTARDQSRKPLDKDFNWQVANGALSSDKFLSQQGADWRQEIYIAAHKGTRKEGREETEN